MNKVIIEYGENTPLALVEELLTEVADIVSQRFDGELVESTKVKGADLAILVEYTVQDHGYSSERDLGCVLDISRHILKIKDLLILFVDMVPITVRPTDLKNTIPAHINQIFN